MKRKVIVWSLAVITALTLTGCGDSTADSGSYKSATPMANDAVAEEAYYDGGDMVSYASEDYEMYDEASGASAGTNTTTTENASTSNRKLIRDVSLSVETKEYDTLVKNLSDSITALGGYVENMDMHNYSYNSSRTNSRNSYIRARIPAKNLDTFINTIGEQTNVTNRSESVRDVTLTYVDMESHKNVLIAERDRLMEYLERAETIEEMMSIEDHLTDIRYQIESMESQLRTFDNQVDFSTVDINITEVIDYTPIEEPTEPKTAWERISEGFSHSLRDVIHDVKEFFIDLIIDLPYIVITLIKIAIVVFILRLILLSNKRFRNWVKTRKEERKERKAEKKAAKAAKKEGKVLETSGSKAGTEVSDTGASESEENKEV